MSIRANHRANRGVSAILPDRAHFGRDSSGPGMPILEKMSDPHAAQGPGVFLERKTDLSSGHGAAGAAGDARGLELAFGAPSDLVFMDLRRKRIRLTRARS